MEKRKKFGVGKVLTVVLVAALIVCCVVGGTVAWLTAESAPVINTFTYGDINITLEETDMKPVGANGAPVTGGEDVDHYEKEFKMLPGGKLTKDPTITVVAGSEACWLFVELVESENFDEYLSYSMAEGWIQLDAANAPGVWYREVDASAQEQDFTVIKDNIVTVKETVTKEMLNALDIGVESPNYPTLTVTAYAVQYDMEIEAINTAVEAWALAKPAEGADA